tara:strand:- start:883 stop:2574 length:1692 start_codon:yes stop_codon:yes gene_type:complete
MLTSTVNTFEVASASADSYTFNYAIHKATDLKVYIDGTLTASNDSTNPFTTTIAANKQSASVAFTNTGNSAPHRSKALKFERVVEYKQETDLANNSLLDAESLETSLDNIVMQTQQAGIKAETSLGFDVGIPATDYHTTAVQASTLNVQKSNRANKALAFDANGDLTVSTDDIDAQIAAVTTQATNAAGSATAAASSASDAADDLAELKGIYRGSQTATPSNPQDGHLWFDTNTGVNILKVYNADTSGWEQLTPTATEQTQINTLTLGKDGTVSQSGTNLNIVQVDKVADDIANVNTVAGIQANVTTVAGISSNVTSVANDATDIGKVAGKETEIGLLGALDTEIGLLGTSAMAHASTGHLKKLSDVNAHITTLGPISADITATAGATTEMDTIVNKYDGGTSGSGTNKNLALINSVHGKITEIGRLGTADATADLAILGTTDAVADMNTLSADPIPANMATVAGIASNVTTVAGISANVTTVAGVHANVTTVANSIADVNRYANEYKIASSAPGSPNEGDMWSDTTNKVFKVYNGTAWATVTDGVSAEEANASAISMAIALG